MNELTTFQFQPAEGTESARPVRAVTIDGEPWFVARDVCDVLGLTKDRDAVARLDRDERGSVKVDTLGGAQSVNIISESGLYALILRSNKPEAKAFRKWVTATVLPTIRKTGSYVRGEEAFDVTTEAGLAAATMHVMAALQAKADGFKAMYEAAKPKADAFTVIEEAKGSMTVTEAAKALKAKRDDLYGHLEHRKWVTKGKRRQATASALRSGYMDTRTQTDTRGRVHTTPVVTPKGLAYLAEIKAKQRA
ncbi:phage antirepressor KilAC domain-containing protein [Rhodobacter capsulatus]|uniref:phage antirepressor n=1 Tax=Rhodobacter capsulatus TaxID=1061 RepID=UPI0009C0E906|nr:phage antirepressor [Rhodobacter capsulatus]PZX21331.1 phage antirepressor protein KilAC domain-containing protein [Rhodobacter capsulatus]QNR64764.1 phage antirepressor KilAC domain-containing protein [Rhodobacter capsulatus]